MNHPREDLLHDYADDELPRADRSRIEEHLGECPVCRATVGEILQLRESARAAFLASDRSAVEPSAEQWSAIERRLSSAPSREVLSPSRGSRIRPDARTLGWAAVIALLVGVSTVMGLWRTPAGPEESPAPVMTGANPEMQPATLMVRAYEPVIIDLERLLEEGRNRLQPETVEILEENLRIIDAAIVEVEEALLSDPGRPGGLRSLDVVLQAKLNLLSEAVGLANGA